MEDWQLKALSTFPELEYEINRNQGGPLSLWDDLNLTLEKAYQETPINEDLIRRVYDYAAWCLRQPGGENTENDLASATAVGLIESLPLDARISGDLYRWMSVETFEGCENLFRHHVSQEQYCRLRDNFLRKKEGFAGPSSI
jgi:hypothetical protein